MAEETQKREIEHIPGDKPDDGKLYLHTAIGFGRKPDAKYEIYWLVPTTGIVDELKEMSGECQERYNCDLVDLIEMGVRQMSTRPNYQMEGFDSETGELFPEGHEKMQALADAYKVGARSAGPSIKSKAAKLDQMEKKYGSQEEIEAKLKRLAELEASGQI